MVGPNAILQTVAALRMLHGERVAAATLYHATGRTLETLPDRPVDEREAAALMVDVRRRCGDGAIDVLREAGVRTADYILAHRIPAAAQRILRLLPAAVASWMLWRAAARHAWTFAGSGRFTYRVRWSPRRRTRVELQVADCSLCRHHQAEEPQCAYYAAAFERLQRSIVGDGYRVAEVECMASGGRACRFVAACA